MNTGHADPFGDADEPALLEFLCHLHRGRKSAGMTFAAILAISLIVAALIPASYKATASVAVLPAPEYTVRPEAGSGEVNNSALAMDQIMRSESAILDSDDLHAEVLGRVGPGTVFEELDPSYRPGLFAGAWHGLVRFLAQPWRAPPRDPAAAAFEKGLARFRAHLLVLPSKDGNVIGVSFNHRDPIVAARVVNSLIEAYAAHRSLVYDDPQLAVIRTDVETAGRAVASAEQSLADFKRRRGISDSVAQRGLLLHRRSDAEQAAAEAAATAAEQQARLDVLSAQLRAEPATVGLFQEHDPDARAEAIRAGLQDLHARLAAAHGRYLDTSRTVRDLIGQIAAGEHELRRLAQDASASVVRVGRNPAIDQLRLDRDHAAAERAAAAARRDSAQAEAQHIGATLAALDADDTELALRQRRVVLDTDALAAASRILAARRLTEAEDARRFARVRVIQPALVPQRPRNLPLLVIAAGVLLGGIAAAGRVVAMYLLRPTFLTAEGLAAATGLPILAAFEQNEAVAA